MPSKWRTVWIVGASTGIGRQLALDLADTGARVAASARSVDRLNQLADSHQNITSFPLDVTDIGAVAAIAETIADTIGPIDLVVCSAASWQPMGAEDFDAAAANTALTVNVAGVNNVLDAVMPAMIARRAGHIAIVASVAGYRGLPRAVAYGPTKAALINLAECLRPDLARYDVGVSIINPGFVDTPMTRDNDFPMPFIMSVEAASAAIVKGLDKGRFEIAFPWRFVMLLKFARLLPYALYFWFTRNLSARRANTSG